MLCYDQELEHLEFVAAIFLEIGENCLQTFQSSKPILATQLEVWYQESCYTFKK